ncbi:MAG: hypothetical protein U0836_11065 [Pirellulales bacterium]
MAVRFRRLFQFSLRSMLLLAVLVGLVCGVILIPAARSRRELPVIAQIEKRGGTAVRSFVPTPATEFAARFLGQEPFLRVTEVSLAESGATDADLLAIGRLGELRKLDLSHTYVTDDGLARLVSGLPELRVLDLTLANIGPRGLAALAGNANLEWVFTFGTATDYADLETLAKKLPGVPLVEQRARHEAEEFGYWVDERTFAPSLLSDPPDEQTVERMFDHLARIPDLWKLVWTEPDHAGLLVSRLGRLSSLRMLDLEGLASLDLDPIFDLPRLVELRISLSEDASGKSLPPPPARLGQLPRLRRLELSNVVAGDGLELLATLSGLRSLTIDGDSSWGARSTLR